MTSHLYSKPTRSGAQKLVLVLLVVILLLAAALVFVWLKPGGSTTPGAAAPANTNTPVSSAPAGSSGAPATSGGTSAPQPAGTVQWGIPVPGDGGPSTKNGAGVPRGYDASDAGATKAAINAVVAARWMKFRIDNPGETLGELAVTDEAARAAMMKLLVPTEGINVETGKKEVEASPTGGKVLGAHLVARDAATAKVAVLWENFAAPVKQKMAVSLEPIALELRWENGDWLIAGVNTFPPVDAIAGDPSLAPEMFGPIGQVQDWVPVPVEGWYW